MTSSAFVPRARRAHAFTQIAGASLSLFASLSASAQTSPPSSTLSPVVVTATRFDQRLSDALPFTTVLTREDIERSQALDLPALLSREAGLAFADNGGRGKASSVYLRGASSRQVLVLLDGVPMNKQDASGAVSLEHLVLDSIERIEVVRGNVSALYGSNAIGGVIQIFTRRASGAPKATVVLEGGSEKTRHASVSADAKLGSTSIAGGVSYHDTDGRTAIDPTRLPAANPDRDGYRNQTAWASLAHEFAPGQSLALRLHHADGRFDFDSAFDTPDDLQTGRTKLDTVSLASDNRYTQDWRGIVTLSQTRDENRNRLTGAFGYDDRYVSRTRLIGWSNQIALGSDWSASAGLERQRQSVDVADGFGGGYDRERDADAVYGGLQGKLGAHSVQLNVRRDKVDGAGSATTGLLGYGYAFTEAWKATASISNAFNAAPLGYLYAPFFGNPELQPERARSAEAGLQYSEGSTLVRATAFRSRVRNEFEYDFGTSRFENVARTRNRGVELAANGDAMGIAWRASLTLQKPEDEATGEQRLRRAKRFGNVGITWPVGAWEIGADVRASSERPDTGAQRLPGYALLDLRARWRLTPEWQLFARGENLTDRDWETVYGYPQSGRSFFVGLQYQPKW